MRTSTKMLLLAGRRGVIGRIAGFSGNGLVGIWPLNELSGTTVTCQNNSALSVASGHVGVALGQSGPYGLVSPLYDGINNYSNVFSAALAAVFNGAVGTFLIFGKIASAGVWADSTNRRLFTLYTDANNVIHITKSSTANTIVFNYTANTTASATTTTSSSLSWLLLGITWSASANQVKAYMNNAQAGTTQTGLGTWAGALTAARVGSTVGAAYHSGWLSCGALFSRALSLAEIKYIYGGGPG